MPDVLLDEVRVAPCGEWERLMDKLDARFVSPAPNERIRFACRREAAVATDTDEFADPRRVQLRNVGWNGVCFLDSQAMPLGTRCSLVIPTGSKWFNRRCCLTRFEQVNQNTVELVLVFDEPLSAGDLERILGSSTDFDPL